MLLKTLLCILIGSSALDLSAENKISKKSPTKAVKKKTVKKPSKKISKETRLKANIKKLKALIKKNPRAKKLSIKLGDSYMALKDYDTAIEVYRSVLTNDDMESYLKLAKAYRLKKSFLDEIRILNILIPKFPNYPKLYYLQGNAFFAIKKYEDATLKYRKAISVQPKYKVAYWGLFNSYQIKKNNYESRIVLSDMIKYFGEDKKVYSELCRLWTIDDYFEKSLDICQKAVSIDPKNPSNHVYLGQTHKLMKNKNQAEKILFNAARMFPKNTFSQEQAGITMEENENYELAYNYFKQCIKIDKNQNRCLIGHARSTFQLGKYKESLSSYIATCKNDRTILPEFKRQGALLRINRNKGWHEKFSQGVLKCYY
ncbi:MAG: tetratricopeptide repeat protein [Bdellovibrionales bacterium]